MEIYIIQRKDNNEIEDVTLSKRTAIKYVENNLDANNKEVFYFTAWYL